MPDLCAADRCCGCSACCAACPQSAITMIPDDEGFLRPCVNGDKCVGCNLCVNACPELHRQLPRVPFAVYAVRAKDDGLRMQSSSGGVFSLLARQVFAKGGIVYGAAVRKGDLMVCHQSAECEEELALLRGSKYVQSEIGETYRSVKEKLCEGRQVLFTGTPCQTAGLRSYLAKEYANLLCVDVICHAVPSPLAWRRYLAERAAEIKGRACDPCEAFDHRRIFFRRKNFGWKRFSLLLGHGKREEHLGVLGKDAFLRGFLSELYNRPSCHQCPFRDLRSGSDLTIGDYWGAAEKMPDMDDDKGTSVVLVNTEKGKCAWQQMRESIVARESCFEDVVEKNPAIWRDCVMHGNRARFFKAIKDGYGFDSVVDRMLKPPAFARLRVFAVRVVRKIARVVK